MPENAKQFAKQLNSCLDETNAPANVRERAIILSKLLDIPKQQAWSILEGLQLPDQALLNKIATEFEVDIEWLCGEKTT